MRRARLTSVLALLCAPALLAAAALLPLAAMGRADRARLEDVHPLAEAVDTGAPSPEALEIPLVSQLYQQLLTQDAAGGETAALDCTEQDVLGAFEQMRPALPADWAGLVDAMAAQAAYTQVTGTEQAGGFSARELQFCREPALWDGTRSFGTLSAVIAPDGVTPVQLNLYLNLYAMPRPSECPQPGDLTDPYGVLERAARLLELDGLGWEPAALGAAENYWCIASGQANLRLVLHAQERTSIGTYQLDLTLSMLSA